MRALGTNSGWATVKPRTVFGNETIVFVGTAGVLRTHVCSSLPSSCTPTKVLRTPGVRSSSERASVRGLVLNFAGLHLLHMYPHRPWWWDDPAMSDASNAAQKSSISFANCSAGSQLCHFADFEGFANLEQWMEKDINEYRASLPNSRIVVATPNWVCDSRYYGYYNWLTTSTEGVKESAESCTRFVTNHSNWPQLPNLHATCRSSQQSSKGTVTLSTRLRKVATRLNVSLADWNGMTREQCNHTKDGRHYDREIVGMQLQQLHGLLGAYDGSQ